MKKLFLLSGISILLLSNSDCSKKHHSFKGRLEVKGICMNYTISVLEGDIDTSLVEANWTDETTGKMYKNVFKLGSPCTFPANIENGDEFYFELDPSAGKDCAVCMAYYPTPSKSIAIKVTKK